MVASALVEMRKCDAPTLHLAHLQPVAWNTVCKPIAEALCLPLVSYNQWLNLLTKSDEDVGAGTRVEVMHRNPALKIVDFFADAERRAGALEAMGMPRMDASVAAGVAPSLQNLPVLTAEDALRWLECWRRVRFI